MLIFKWSQFCGLPNEAENSAEQFFAENQS